MAQQTAVEQLENYMIENFHLTEEALYELKKAKEMEKQQITDFANDYADAVMGGCIKRAEEYYTQTYGK
jgi:TPP-dependent pyruvate/acetoin dehydrogenase alpha subunit